MNAFFKLFRLYFSAVLFVFAIAVYGQFAPQKIKNGLFIENKGQWESQVLYRSEIPSGQLYIEQERFLFNFWDAANGKDFHSHGSDRHSTDPDGINKNIAPVKAHSYEVRFLGATAIRSKQGINPTTYSHNYFKGTDKNKWADNVKGYQSILLNEIYPNTSLVCFGQETGFKYEFHLQPGADASLIQLQYNGVDTVYLKNGELIISTSINTFHEEKPFSYQEIDGKRIPVECNFRLKNSVLSFVFPKGYNKAYPLVIDPQLIFSTYSGSTSDNWGNSATYDDDGNTYMIGICFGSGYPVTTGAYQIHYNGSWDTLYYSNGTPLYKIDPDIAIMKFDPTGVLLYATYLGGTETEIPSSTIVNSQKQLVVLGVTSSNGNTTLNGNPGIAFPTTSGAYNTNFNGGTFAYPFGALDAVFFDWGSDLFVTILSENGNSIVASTFIGGSSNDGISYINDPLSSNYGDQFRAEILCDSTDNIYVVTKTFSTDIINSSVPGYDKSFNGYMDGYVCKLNAGLTTMIWDSYIGGSGDDASYSIQIASDQSIYIAGGTTSSDIPGTSTGIKTSNVGGNTDGYIVHLSSDGTSLLNATYIGTTSYDQAFLIQLDNTGNVYTFGQTLGNYPMTPGVYGQPSTGQFIQKLDSKLTTSLMSTTFGNTQNAVSIVPTAFLVNDCGNLMLSGWGGTVNSNYINQYCACTYSSYLGGNTNNLPLTPDALQSVTDGSDFYIMVLNKNATSLVYSTYFGGYGEVDHVDGGTSRFDKKGIIYQSVCASCDFNANTSVFPTTPNAYARVKGAQNCNNAVFKLDLSNLIAGLLADTTKGCPPAPINLTNTSIGGKTFFWIFGDGDTSDQFGPIKHTYQKPGTYTVKLIATDLTTCTRSDTAEKTITVHALPELGAVKKDTAICVGDSISFMTICNPSFNYLWSPNTFVRSPTECNTTFNPGAESTYILAITDTNYCVSKDTFTIHMTSLQKGIISDNLSPCHGKPNIRFSNTSTGPLTYLWTFGDGSSSTDASPVHEFSKDGSYPIVVNIFNEYCSETETDIINVAAVDIPNLFTPNGDTYNDCFQITGLYNNWHVEIYNRWSKCVFKSDDYQNDFCGEDLSSSVYYYLVCPPYGDCCKGWVQIMQDK